MQRPKAAAMTVALVTVATGTAFALNIGVISATGPASAGGETASGEPEVVTVVVDVPGDEAQPTSSDASAPTADDDAAAAGAAAAAAPAGAAAAPAPRAVPVAAAPSSPAPPATAAPTTAAPTTAPPTTAAPTTTVSEPTATEYLTFPTGAGEVVIARTGNTLEFWAAHPTGGWEYSVEHASGREVEIDFRRGEDEAEFKVTLENGRVRVESEGFGGGGDDD